MAALTYEEIRARIKTATNLPEAEIDEKVGQKLKQLSDLVSKEGAAHIVANDLGVKIFQQQKLARLKVNELQPMMRNVEVLARVVKQYGIRSFKTDKREGRVASFLIGDGTGIVRATIWDEPIIKQVEHLLEQNTVLINGAYVKVNNGFKELHLGSGASIKINPDNEVLPATKMTAENKSISELKERDLATIAGTIVQVFEPRFYEACGICGKKVQAEDGKCVQHGPVEKKTVPILNVIIDDGTDNIRVVCFRDLAETVAGMKCEELSKMKDDAALADNFKKSVLGKQIQVTGRVNMNEMFARLEMVAQSLKDATPAEIVAVVKHEDMVM